MQGSMVHIFLSCVEIILQNKILGSPARRPQYGDTSPARLCMKIEIPIIIKAIKSETPPTLGIKKIPKPEKIIYALKKRKEDK